MPVGAAIALHTHRTHTGKKNHGALPNMLVLAGCGQLFTHNRIRRAQGLKVLAGHLTHNADTQTGAGERLACHDLLGNTQLTTDRANLILKQGTQRLDQLKRQILRQAAHIMVRFNIRRALATAGFDHIRVQGALHQELDLRALFARFLNELALGLLEGADELAANNLTLLLRFTHTSQCGEETL